MANTINHGLVGLLIFVLLFGHSSYSQDNFKSKLEFDHIILFVSAENLKDSLDNIFTPAEKLTTEHISQGTIGYYYLFYNTYIELLFLQDSAKARLNKDNFGSDYLLRWTNDEGYCPIGFGMSLSPWDTSAINSKFHKYQSLDSKEGEFYLMSRYNSYLAKPFIYITQPHHTYKALESLDGIDERPKEIRNDSKKYLTHKSHVKNLTQIAYASSNENNDEGNMGILQRSSAIHVEYSDSTSLTLIFDNGGNKQKEFMLTNEIKLIIEY